MEAIIGIHAAARDRRPLIASVGKARSTRSGAAEKL
jgi:hypothetical protein